MASRPLKRVLVTGGAGFIGSNLVRALGAGTRAEIVVLDNLSSGFRENLDRGPVTFVHGDVRDPLVVSTAVDGCDTVFHLAASVGNMRSIEHPLEDAEINVLGTLRILEGARRAGVTKIVYSSSAGIFGELKTMPIREDHPLEPGTPYGTSKLCGEKLCLVYAKLYSIECIAVRYFNVYGERQRYDAYGNVIPIFVRQAIRGEPITVYGDGEQTRDFVNVRDVAQANLRAAACTGVSGAFNIASGTHITINRLVDMVLEETGSRSAVIRAEPRQGDVRHSLADISAARAAFDYEPNVRIKEGLGEYVSWARRAGMAAH